MHKSIYIYPILKNKNKKVLKANITVVTPKIQKYQIYLLKGYHIEMKQNVTQDYFFVT